MTQLEIPVALPLFLALWLSSTQSYSKRVNSTAFFLAGIFAGVVVIFKLLLALIAVAFVILSAANAMAIRKYPLRFILRTQLVPVTAGVAIPLACIAVWFASLDALPDLIYNSFILPIEMLQVPANANVRMLAGATVWLGSILAPWLLLVVLALDDLRRRDRDLITLQLIAWIIVGSLLILLQKHSWWEYHFLLLLVPFGIMAIRGVDVAVTFLSDNLNGSRRLGYALACILVYPAFAAGLFPWGMEAEEVALAVGSEGATGIVTYQRSVEPRGSNLNYGLIYLQSRFLSEPSARPGAVYVFGDPRINLVTGRPQGVSVHGWALKTFSPRQWQNLAQRLMIARPTYIFVAEAHEEIISENSPPIKSFLSSAYVVLKRDDGGTWYELASRSLTSRPYG